MEIRELSADGLKRELQVVVGADELGQKFHARLDEIKDTVQLKGFRKGKVPVTHLKKVYGKQLMAEVLEQAVKETSTKAIRDRNERPALQPSISLPEEQAEIERVIAGEADLSYSMKFEVLPEIEIADLTKLELELLVAEVDDEAMATALAQLADRGITFDVVDDREVVDGDRVTIDFVGKIDGEAFDGGTAEDQQLVIGLKNFIPGFEDGLIGAKAGDERVVDAHFPEEYHAKHLAGKTAQFDTKVKAVAAPTKPEMNDEFAKSLGVEGIDKLKELLKAQIAQEYAEASRLKIKRELLDKLDTAHQFELPQSLVDREFEGIWAQLNQGLKQSGKTFEDEGKTEDEAREEYRRIADRRVRLGLVIGEIGDRNKIQVTQEELRGALMQQARQYPGQEKMVYEFYEKNPDAVAEMRAPIFEDKVVDHVLAEAKPTERKVSREELFKEVEDVTEG